MNPSVPQFLTAAQAGNEKQIDLTWTQFPDALYNLYRDNVVIHPLLDASGLADTDIEYNRQYIYSLTSVIDDVESARSVPVILSASASGLPFATPEELATYWRELTEAEVTRATALILIASNRLRAYAGTTVDLDTKSAADSGFRSLLNWVVMEAVKRAMQAPTDMQPVESSAMTAGPYSENFKYTNPTGDLWFKKAELSALGLSTAQSMGSVTPNTDARDFYGSEA